jgi:hypothetical protein
LGDDFSDTFPKNVAMLMLCTELSYRNFMDKTLTADDKTLLQKKKINGFIRQAS